MDTQNQSKSSWYVPIVSIDFHRMKPFSKACIFWLSMGCHELSARHDRFCVKTGSRCRLNGLESQSSHFLLGEDRRRTEAFFLVFSLGKSKEKHLRKSTWGCSSHFFSEMMFVMKGNTLRNMCFFSISHFRFLVVNLRPVLYLHKYSMSKIIPCETSQIQHLIYDTPQCRRWQFPTFFSATCTKSWLLLRQKKLICKCL